jgi:hypothetical protein
VEPLIFLDDRDLHSVNHPRLTKSARQDHHLMKKGIRFVMMAALTFCMGCATLWNPGAPDQSFDEDNDIQVLEQHYGQAGALTSYYAVKPETVAARNEFVAGRLTLINLQYIKFIRGFAATKSQMDSAFDLLITGVGLATAVTGGEAAKAALGAAAAGLGATRTSIDKNFFYEKTVPTLITAMNAQRKVVLVSIIEGIKRDIENYPLAQALSDLSEYYFAGTFVGALQAIQKDAGAKEEAADKKIEIARLPEAAVVLASQPVRDKVRALLKKIDALSPDQALALAKNPPVADGALAPALLKQYPTKAWETDPVAARAVLKFRVTTMVNPVVDLPEWDKALP